MMQWIIRVLEHFSTSEKKYATAMMSHNNEATPGSGVF
jgi:hypothetical protein